MINLKKLKFPFKVNFLNYIEFPEFNTEVINASIFPNLDCICLLNIVSPVQKMIG